MEGMTMKKIFRLFPAALAVAAFASCADKMDNEVNAPVQDDNLVQMTFSASMEEDVDSKTTYSGRKVYWEASDAITVFSVGETVTRTSFADPVLLENNAVAQFSGVADASAATYYAVYPHSDANTFDKGTFSVTFPAEQTAVANGFASGSNVSVAVSVKDAEVAEQNLQFKNVGALLAFSFGDLETALNTASVTFKAKKSDTEYWGLAGATTLTFDENNLPVAAEGDVQAVVVNAPKDGFKTGVNYFVPVIPVGACTGMELVYTDLNGDKYTKNNDLDFELLRSYMFNVGHLPNPYPEIEMPADFDITLDFESGNWPFREPCKYISSSGETYTYVYEFVHNGKTKRAVFSLRMGYKPYEMTSAGLKNTETNAFLMACPAVADRYLTQFVAKTSYPLSMQSRWSNSSDGPYCLLSSNTAEWGTRLSKFYSDYIIFYNDEDGVKEIKKFAIADRQNFAPAPGKQYWLKFRWTGTLAYVTYTYSSSAPGAAPTAAGE